MHFFLVIYPPKVSNGESLLVLTAIIIVYTAGWFCRSPVLVVVVNWHCFTLFSFLFCTFYEFCLFYSEFVLLFWAKLVRVGFFFFVFDFSENIDFLDFKFQAGIIFCSHTHKHSLPTGGITRYLLVFFFLFFFLYYGRRFFA